MIDALDPAAIREPELTDGWTLNPTSSTARQLTFDVVAPDGARGSGTLLRCLGGRFQDAYPVAAHDLELIVTMDRGRSAALNAVAAGALEADRQCRRVVVAVPADDDAALDDADAAGLREVVVVDIAEGREARSWRLMVLEPEWVTEVDIHLDKVPGT